MKIPSKTYESVKADIKEIIKFYNLNPMEINESFMWRMLHKISADRSRQEVSHRILPYDGRKYCFYYENDCNDNHVTTMLRRILKEL